MIKSLFKKRSFWLFAIVLITAIVLISQFSGGVLYEVKYECTQNNTLTNVVIFHDNNVVEIYKYTDPYNKRKFANYATDGDYVYIYEYGDTTYSSKIKIENRFNLSQEGVDGIIKMQALQPTIIFGVLMFANILCLGCGIITTIQDVRNYKKNKQIKASE